MSLRRSLARVPEWLAPPVPARRLAIVRIVVMGYACAWLAGVGPDLLARAAFAPSRFAAVGLAVWTGPVAPTTVAIVLVATALAGLAVLLGVGYRGLAPAFAVALAWLLSYRNSWGHMSHGEHLLVLHVGVLALAPAADALRPGRREPEPADHGRYGWPLQLLMLVTVSTYAIAGLAKLHGGGWAWLSGDAVRLHVAHEALRMRLIGAPVSPLAALLLPHAWLFAVAAWGTVALELGAPLALRQGLLRRAWLVGVWGMHVGIWAVMGIGFPYPLSGVAFVGFVATERVWASVASILARAAARARA